MALHPMVRSLLLPLALTAGAAALAQVSVNLVFAPPAPVHETMPLLQPGYVWAPGYWAWNQDRHIWVRGRPLLQRTGYRWEPDRWEQHNGNFVRQPGRWEHDESFPAAKFQKPKKAKHDQGQRDHGASGESHRKQRKEGH
ncbi:MAG: YXWGXW repeat-containing protein [Rhodoferax sp.]|nr:YXWGXW repeat-containing protein [Rhodoferax sp.]